MSRTASPLTRWRIAGQLQQRDGLALKIRRSLQTVRFLHTRAARTHSAYHACIEIERVQSPEFWNAACCEQQRVVRCLWPGTAVAPDRMARALRLAEAAPVEMAPNRYRGSRPARGSKSVRLRP